MQAAAAIQYAGRQGQRLTGVTRGVTLDGTPFSRLGLQTAGAKKFVTDWAKNLFARVNGTDVPLWELPTYMAYVVPISIHVSGEFIDPSQTRRTPHWRRQGHLGCHPGGS